jgi:hypothetical protein
MIQFMKTIVLLFLLTTTGFVANAQLANTKWNGVLNVPDPLDVVLDFKKDVVDVIMDNNGEAVETMAYTIQGDVLTLRKVSGQSSCDTTSVATLKFTVVADKLSVTPVSDECPLRAGSWTKDAFVKVKQ